MYVCPNCGGNLKYSIEKKAMLCGYCDSTFDPYAVAKEKDAEEHTVDYDTENGGFSENTQPETPLSSSEYEATVFTCPQCGAEIMSEDNEAAAFCSYCGGSTILDSRISRFRRPDYIIPFSVTKDDCLKGYQKMMGRALFAPKSMKDPSVIESFRGIYMPYWSYTFDLQKEVSVTGKKSYQRGDYSYTEYHSLSSNVKAHYDNLSHDASSTFADNLSMAIAPFDQKQQMEFTPSYLSGFYADACDLGANVYEQDEAMRVASDCYSQFHREGTVRKYSVERKAAEKQFMPECTEKKMIMLPVWFMSTRVKEKGQERVTYAVVNGQTGETAGDVPIDVKKYMGVSLGIAALLFVLMNYLMDLTISPMATMVFTGIFGVVTYAIYYFHEKSIMEQETGESDKGLMAARAFKKPQQADQSIFDENRPDLAAGKENKKEKKKVKLKKTFVWLPFVVILALAWEAPIEDSWYYGGAILSLAVLLRMILMIILRINALATRPLPQFKRTGGDDRAK